ncbi:retinoic acid early transcript 1E-like isoform X2 [Saccopteryx leptura]|uniref:retinoic acid early transcript 1E-like isoform X2 n=1 Tax=Saccopteryx leptura TaxID=249018 RepID=UPI00339BA6FE
MRRAGAVPAVLLRACGLFAPGLSLGLLSPIRMTAPTKCSRVFLLLLLLLSCVRAAPRHAHSLCLSFTVRSPSEPGQPWGQAHGSLDEEVFFQYDSDSNKVSLFGHLGEKVNGTDALTKIPQILEDRMRRFRMELAEMKKVGSLTLRLWCLQEAGRCTGAFIRVIFNGKPVLLFDAIKETWININSTAGGTQENWEGIKKLAKDFRNILKGDFNQWLREFLEHMEKVREPTELSTPRGPLAEKVNATNACTELPQTQQERTREHSMDLSDVSLEKNRTRDTPQHSTSLSTGWIIGIIALAAIVMTIIIGAGIYFVRKRRRSGTMKAIPSSDASSLDHDTVVELNETLMTESDVDDNDTSLAVNHRICRSGLSRNT